MAEGHRWIPVAALVASGCVGDVEAPNQLEPLSTQLSSLHQAPDADGRCSGPGAPLGSWTTELTIDDQHLPLTAGAIDVGVDQCGSVVVAWRGHQSNGKHLSVARLLPDGDVDWQREFTHRM